MSFLRGFCFQKNATFEYLLYFFLGVGTCAWALSAKAQISSQRPINPQVQFMTSEQMVKAGRALYLRHCMGCHGVDAKGAGPASAMLNPKPRNLVAGAFKFRSTPLGSLPTTEDLIRTLNQGVLGTSMPSFHLLSEKDKYALVAYIKSLREWTESTHEAVSMPAAPKEIFGSKAGLLTAALRGEALYKEACHTCHGDGGLGKGPDAAGLTDSDNNPIVPANLQKLYIKGGRTARDVFRAISMGLDGTPMPAFAEVYDEAKRWDLVAYVFHLRGIGSGIYSKEETLKEAVEKISSSAKTDSSTKKDEVDGWN